MLQFMPMMKKGDLDLKIGASYREFINIKKVNISLPFEVIEVITFIKEGSQQSRFISLYNNKKQT